MTRYRLQYRGKNLESVWRLAENGFYRRGNWWLFGLGALPFAPLLWWHTSQHHWLAVGALVLWFVWLVTTTRAAQRRNYLATTAETPDFEYAVLPEGLECRQKHGRTLHFWKTPGWVKLQPEGICLKLQRRFIDTYLLLPRVCFESDAHYEAFLREFEQARTRCLANPEALLPLADELGAPPRFELRCEYTLEDYAFASAQKLLAEQYPETLPAGIEPPPESPWKRRLRLSLLGVTVLILMFGKPWVDPRTLPMQENFVHLMLTFMYAIGVLIVFFYWQRWVNKRKPAVETTITLDELGYAKRDPYERDHGVWSELDALIEEPQRFTLWRRGALALIVPRRVFAEAEEDRACRDWLWEKLPLRNMAPPQEPAPKIAPLIPDTGNPYQAPQN